MYWIDVAQDRDRWQALVNVVMNRRIDVAQDRDRWQALVNVVMNRRIP